MSGLRFRISLKSKKSRLISALSLFVLFNLAIFTVLWISKRQNDHLQQVSRFEKFLSPHQSLIGASSSGRETPAENETTGLLRRVYPLSVIDGGVQNPGELRVAIERDSVVAGHFSGFNFRTARVIQSHAKKAVHVSYRVRDRVYWTRKKVILAKGEKLVTDGSYYVRSRCGNQISEIPRSPILSDEPPEAVLNSPLPDQKSLPVGAGIGPGQTSASPETGLISSERLADGPKRRLPLIIPGLIGGGYLIGRAFQDEASGNSPKIVVPPPPVVDVPEPGSLTLLVSGLAGLLAYGQLRRLR
jgi:hypothetical protein